MNLLLRMRYLFPERPFVLLDWHNHIDMTLETMPVTVHSSLPSRVLMCPDYRSLAVVAGIGCTATALIRTE
jgi:hypothetical protein